MIIFFLLLNFHHFFCDQDNQSCNERFPYLLQNELYTSSSRIKKTTWHLYIFFQDPENQGCNERFPYFLQNELYTSSSIKETKGIMRGFLIFFKRNVYIFFQHQENQWCNGRFPYFLQNKLHTFSSRIRKVKFVMRGFLIFFILNFIHLLQENQGYSERFPYLLLQTNFIHLRQGSRKPRM